LRCFASSFLLSFCPRTGGGSRLFTVFHRTRLEATPLSSAAARRLCCAFLFAQQRRAFLPDPHEHNALLPDLAADEDEEEAAAAPLGALKARESKDGGIVPAAAATEGRLTSASARSAAASPSSEGWRWSSDESARSKLAISSVSESDVIEYTGANKGDSTATLDGKASGEEAAEEKDVEEEEEEGELEEVEDDGDVNGLKGAPGSTADWEQPSFTAEETEAPTKIAAEGAEDAR